MINFFINPKNTVLVIFYLSIASFISLIPLFPSTGGIGAIGLAFILTPYLILTLIVPVISLVIVLSHIFFHLLFFIENSWRFKIAFVTALCSLVILPYFENKRQSELAENLIATDINKITSPLNINKLALSLGITSSGLCTELCYRLLLNGKVKTIIIPTERNETSKLNIKRKGIAHSLKRMSDCSNPSAMLGSHTNLEKKYIKNEVMRPKQFLYLRFAQGICLESKVTTFEEADAIFSNEWLHKRNNRYSSNFKISSDTMIARRNLLYVKANGKMELMYQGTGVKVPKLFPILFPTNWHHLLDREAVGFARKLNAYGDVIESKLSTSSSHANFRQAHHIIVDVIGLSLNLSALQTDVRQIRKEIVVKTLDQSGSINNRSKHIIKDFYDKSAIKEDQITQNDAELMLRIFTENRIILKSTSDHKIPKILASVPQLKEKFAKDVFKRLREINPIEYKENRSDFSDQVYYLSGGANKLPDNILLKHKAEFYRLARDREARVFASDLLGKLHIFGADALPTILHLLEDDKRPLLFEGKTIPWGAKQRTALFALCKLGPVANSAIPKLYEIFQAGKFRKIHSHHLSSPIIRTLLKIGVQPNEIWDNEEIVHKTHSREEFYKYVDQFKEAGRC